MTINGKCTRLKIDSEVATGCGFEPCLSYFREQDTIISSQLTQMYKQGTGNVWGHYSKISINLTLFSPLLLFVFDEPS